MEKSVNTYMALGSSLPLIFVGGRPACLDSMTLPQLKRFIPFMLLCEGMGHEVPLVQKEGSPKPSWWPMDLEFSIRIYLGDGSSSTEELLDRLRDVVRRCYKNYNLCSIIALSTSMSDPKNPFGFVRIEHNDNGTCNVISCSNKLVVTIRSGVVKYDEEFFAPETNIAIRQCLYNRPILKLVKSSYADSKYADGKIQVPYSTVNSIRKLNPSVIIPGLLFVNSKGHKIQYPFLNSGVKNSFMTGQVSTMLDGDNVCKVVVLSDCEATVNHVGQRNGLKSSFVKEPQVSDGSSCQYCKKVFSGEDFCKDHEISCVMAPTSKKTDSEQKLDFIASLDLVPTKKAKTFLPVQEKHDMILEKLIPVATVQNGTRRFKKNKPPKPKPKRISSFFKIHPIPFTSGLGLKLIQNSETGSYTFSTNIDQACSTSDRIQHLSSQNWNITTLKKKVIQKQDWVHTYAFTRQERIIRNSEIIVGVSANNWTLLNKCKPCSVKIRSSDLVPRNFTKSLNTGTIIGSASHPIVLTEDGESQEALDRRAFENEKPVIQIENIFKIEKYAKYFRKPIK